MDDCKIVIPKDTDVFIDSTQTFHTIKAQTIVLKHTLRSVSKWESKWEVSYLSPDPKHPPSKQMMQDYIRCMAVDENVDPLFVYALTPSDINKIESYLSAKMTATTFPNRRESSRRPQRVTAELIYYWMTQYDIPFECENWNLTRLMTLIRICNNHSSGDKKMSQRKILQQNAELNAIRRAQMHTKG